jgi:hypothetical protein
VDSIVYGNLRIEILAEHGGKIQRTTLQAKPPAIHARPYSSVPSGPVRLQGRDAEVAAAQAISTGEAIEFSAGCGFGKSTLLRHLAAQAGAEAGAGVVYLRVGSQRRGDLLQRLVDALYTANSPFKPTAEQRVQLLARAQALVLLDDVTLGPAQLREVLDALPGCAVVVGSDRPVLGRRGRSITLTGLPNHEALEVLQRDLGRDLTGPERADAGRLCELVDGQPLHLRQAAALVREGRHSLADLARIAEGDVFALDRLSVNALAEQERRVLAVLALAAGALLPSDLVGSITDLTNVWGPWTRCTAVVWSSRKMTGSACPSATLRTTARCCCATSGWLRPPVSWPPGSNGRRGAARRPSPPPVRRCGSLATRPSAVSGMRWSAWSRRSSPCWPWPGAGRPGGRCWSAAWRLPRRSMTSPPRRT